MKKIFAVDALDEAFKLAPASAITVLESTAQRGLNELVRLAVEDALPIDLGLDAAPATPAPTSAAPANDQGVTPEHATKKLDLDNPKLEEFRGVLSALYEVTDGQRDEEPPDEIVLDNRSSRP